MVDLAGRLRCAWRAVALVLLVAAPLIIAGCGSSSGNDGGSPSSASSAQPSGSDGSQPSGNQNPSTGGNPENPPSPVAIASQRIQPSDTDAGIDNESDSADFNYVAVPSREADRKNVLIVFLGGSLSSPSDYTDISNFAARLGYAVIDLRVNNDHVVGNDCQNDDSCFTQFRGETIFGQNTAYRPGQPAYDSSAVQTNAANSTVNRLVGALDFLASRPQSATNPVPDGYWAQFLTADNQSPYVVSRGNVYPDWPKIIIAGHSEGGGNAAFLALHLPAGIAVRRVVMFSAPNDHVGLLSSASWINDSASTSLDRFWGLRNADEGALGNYVSANWRRLGGSGVGGAAASGEARVGDGSGDPGGSHRLVTTIPDYDSKLRNHDSTALDSAHIDAVEAAWRYVFTAAGTD